MDIQDQLINNYGKPGVTEIVRYIGINQKRFEKLMSVFFGEDKRLSQRAAWPMSEVALKTPDLLLPYLPNMIALLGNDQTHDAIRRNILRSIQHYQLPEDLAGEAFQHCIDLMLNPRQAIALRAFSITTAATICKQFPELKNEVLESLNIITEGEYGPAIRVRVRDARKGLDKLP